MKVLLSFAGIPLLAALVLFQTTNPVDLTIRPPRRAQVASSSPLHSELVLNTNIALQAFLDALANATSAPIPFSGRRGGCIRKGSGLFRISIGCSWEGTVQRRAAPSISGSGDRFDVTIPFHVRVTGRTEGFFGSGPRETARGDFIATATASPQLNPDWSLSLNLSTDHRWDRELTMWILFDLVPVRLGGTARPVVRDALARLASDFATTVQGLDIRRHADNMWERLHEPLQLSGDPEVWLRLRPTGVRFSGIHIQNDILHASVSITTMAEGVLGERPLAFPASPLPPVEERGQGSERFLGQLPLVLQYGALERQLGEFLRVQQRWAPLPDRPDHYLTVHDVEVFPSGEDLTVGIHFTADVPDRGLDTRGAIYLQGRPIVDVSRRILSVEELTVTATTDNSAVDLALVVFDDRLQSALANALIYPFGDDYDRLLAAANSELTRSITANVSSHGELNYLDVTEIVMGDRGIQLKVLAAGTLRLDLGL